MTIVRYILDRNGEPIAEPALLKWAFWMDSHDPAVARDEIGESTISTVFLGLDHNFAHTGPPILWETMIFGGPLDEEADRCAGSREQAEAMHQRMKERLEAILALHAPG